MSCSAALAASFDLLRPSEFPCRLLHTIYFYEPPRRDAVNSMMCSGHTICETGIFCDALTTASSASGVMGNRVSRKHVTALTNRARSRRSVGDRTVPVSSAAVVVVVVAPDSAVAVVFGFFCNQIHPLHPNKTWNRSPHTLTTCVFRRTTSLDGTVTPHPLPPNFPWPLRACNSIAPGLI